LAVYDPNATFDKKQKKRVGKTGYMAPEVFAKKPYDPRAADIWSMGVMLFMMLIGAPPFPMPSPQNHAFNFIVNGRLKDVLKHWKRLRLVNEEALDLLNKIFVYESKRITMDDILKHPFVNLADGKKKQTEKQSTKSEAETKDKTATKNEQQQQPKNTNDNSFAEIKCEIEAIHRYLEKQMAAQQSSSSSSSPSSSSGVQQQKHKVERVKAAVNE